MDAPALRLGAQVLILLADYRDVAIEILGEEEYNKTVAAARRLLEAGGAA